MQYGEILHSIMAAQPEVVALTAEARAALGAVPKDFPGRFYDLGIAEQNLIGAAAGMAAMGKIVFVHSPLATFITMRSFEQIRTTVAMQGHNVKIPGLLPGLAAGFQGPTHVALEDIGLMRGIPGVTVMAAASQEELKEIMDRAVATDGCVYFQVPPDLPERLDYCGAPTTFDQPRWLRKGKDGLVISMGFMTPIALKAVDSLAEKGVRLALINLCMLDPAPRKALLSIMGGFEKIATVEEHFITGGLGSIVAEIIADAGLGKRLKRIGVVDGFPDRYTTHEANLQYIGLDAQGIAAKLKRFF